MTANIEIDLDSKRNKIIGVIVSALFHALLFILFLFVGLSYQEPPPPEYGIEVDMGGGGGGGGSGGSGSSGSGGNCDSIHSFSKYCTSYYAFSGSRRVRKAR